MIESKQEFNELLNRLKAKQKENKLGKSLQRKLQAFLEVKELINSKNCCETLRNKKAPFTTETLFLFFSRAHKTNGINTTQKINNDKTKRN